MLLEERDDGRVAVFLRDGQWRVSIPRRPIDLGTFVQQQPRRVDVAIKAGDVQRRSTLSVRRRIGVGSAV